jgi:hypothetical protein
VSGSNSQRATAHSGEELPADDAANGPDAEPTPRTQVFIVASPRPQVGKTFVARLLADFLRLDDRDVVAFDLNPSGDALCDYLPELATAGDLGDVKDQMALFDGLIVGDGTAKIVDVGHGSFERFFAIMAEIGYLREARRQSIEPLILFAADPHPVAIKAYADLQRCCQGAILVPVFNEAIAKGQKLRDHFPFTRAATVPLQIPALAPMLKAQMEKSRYSFAEVHDKLPMAIPIGLAFELRAWTRRTFLEFRELELRLLLEKLRASLPGVKL